MTIGLIGKKIGMTREFFDHYEKVPQNVQDEVTKKLA